MEVDEKSEAIHAVTEIVQGVSISDNVSTMTTKDVMLDRVARSDAHFKHQQRGDPDLTYEEKHQIAADILNSKQATFLARFGRYLTEEDLDLFKDKADDYEVGFHLSDIRRQLDDKKNEQKKRNRRFEAMKVMMETGEYFSSESMKERDPLLYEQLIGQYMTQEEIDEEVKGRDLSLSAVLVEHVQSMANSELYNRLCDIEEAEMEDEDEQYNYVWHKRQQEEEVEEEDDDEGAAAPASNPEISESEKQMLKNEFLRTMQLRFLNGDDSQFDYRTVDENVNYDSLDIREQDEEEKYFDQSDSADESCDKFYSESRHSGRVGYGEVEQVGEESDEEEEQALQNSVNCRLQGDSKIHVNKKPISNNHETSNSQETINHNTVKLIKDSDYDFQDKAFKPLRKNWGEIS